MTIKYLYFLKKTPTLNWSRCGNTDSHTFMFTVIRKDYAAIPISNCCTGPSAGLKNSMTNRGHRFQTYNCRSTEK